jgi:hypothetical protein
MPLVLPPERSRWWSRAGQSSSGLFTSSSEQAATPSSLDAGGLSPSATASASATSSSFASRWVRWRPRCGSSPPPASAAPTPSPRCSKGAALPR